MKKLFSIIIIIGMAIAFAACGNSGSHNEGAVSIIGKYSLKYVNGENLLEFIKKQAAQYGYADLDSFLRDGGFGGTADNLDKYEIIELKADMTFAFLFDGETVFSGTWTQNGSKVILNPYSSNQNGQAQLTVTEYTYADGRLTAIAEEGPGETNEMVFVKIPG